METSELINMAYEFMDSQYQDEIYRKINKGSKRIVLDFRKLAEYNPEIAERLMDEPDDTIKCFELAVKNFEESKITKVRFRNFTNVMKVAISELREVHINKIIQVEGVIKQKGNVRPHVIEARFECPQCGNVIKVLQTDERHFKEPSRCSCGRKGMFRKLELNKIDVFSITLEEPVEDSATAKLSQHRVLFKEDLCEPKLERVLSPGTRVLVTGILKEIQIEKAGMKTNQMDWYLDANYVDIKDETYSSIKYTHQDIEKFKEFATDGVIEKLRNIIFEDVYGYVEETTGVVLQMFGGVELMRQGANARGTTNILLVGDPGSAKSTILKIAQKFSPKAIYVAGKGVSGVGITASVVKDELLGGYSLEAGPLVMANEGLVCLDEMDKMDDQHKQSLHEPMEQNTVTISKAGITATLPARTSILAAANPKFGSYSEYESVYSQIELAPTLINRFDLVYPIKESKISKEDDYNIAMKMLNRDKETKSEVSREFIRKYIAHARTLKPVMPDAIKLKMAQTYAEVKDFKRKSTERGLPISARNLDAFRRLAEATARARLHSEITEQDMNFAYEKLLYSIKQLGIDPSTGDVQEMTISSLTGEKVALSEKDIYAKILNFIRQQSLVEKDGAYFDDIRAQVGLEEYRMEEILGKLKQKGEIYNPRQGFWRIIG